MVKIFKTSVKSKKQAREILGRLRRAFPEVSANFDLDDCDKILRIESDSIRSDAVLEIISSASFFGEELE